MGLREELASKVYSQEELAKKDVSKIENTETDEETDDGDDINDDIDPNFGDREIGDGSYNNVEADEKDDKSESDDFMNEARTDNRIIEHDVLDNPTDDEEIDELEIDETAEMDLAGNDTVEGQDNEENVERNDFIDGLKDLTYSDDEIDMDTDGLDLSENDSPDIADSSPEISSVEDHELY